MSNYPGWPLSVTGGLSCPPPQDCCCEQVWELRPGDLAPRWIDVGRWLKQNVANAQDYSLADALLELKITDLGTPASSWPTTPSPVVLPITAGTYFTISKITAHFKDGRFGYSLDTKTLSTATLNSRLRLDYRFKALSGCHGDYEGSGCVLIVIRKCFTGSP